MGATPAAGAPATAPNDSDDAKTEVVARNEAADPVDPVSDRPPIDPADRAAG